MLALRHSWSSNLLEMATTRHWSNSLPQSFSRRHSLTMWLRNGVILHHYIAPDRRQVAANSQKKMRRIELEYATLTSLPFSIRTLCKTRQAGIICTGIVSTAFSKFTCTNNKIPSVIPSGNFFPLLSNNLYYNKQWYQWQTVKFNKTLSRGSFGFFVQLENCIFPIERGWKH